MKIPKQVLELFGKSGKKAADTAAKGTILGKAAKVAGIGGAGALTVEGAKSLINDNNQANLAASEQDNSPGAVRPQSSLPSNVVPFRVNRSLKNYGSAIPEHVPDSVKIDILEKRVGVLEEKVERYEKIEAEKSQSLELANKEDRLEGKVDRVDDGKSHVSGKSAQMMKSIAKEAIGPALLLAMANMDSITKFIKSAEEKVESLVSNVDTILLKLAAAAIPGFAIANMLKKTTLPTIFSKKGGATPPTPKTNPESTAKPTAANDNRVNKIRDKLTKLGAPRWVFDILEKVGKLARITSSKVPFIGAMVVVILNVIEEYNPDIHKNPAEFQKLIVREIVVGLGQSLAFGAIIVLFTLIGGPLGTLAAILAYVIVGDKMDDLIREELVGYLVAYVLFDQDPLEAAKKSGRYRKYEQLKNDADEKLKLAQGNLAVIEGKEGRGEKLTPQEESMKQGFKAQIEGYTKRTQILRTAQGEIEEEGRRQKEYVESGKAAAGSIGTGTGSNNYSPEVKTGSGDLKGGDAMRKQVYDSFVNAGFSDQQAKTMTAEVGRENSYRPDLIYGTHVDPKNAAVNLGFFSWQGSRGKELHEKMKQEGLIGEDGKIIPGQKSLDAMAKFAKYEMETKPEYSKTKKEFLSNPNIGTEEAAVVLGDNYIRWARTESAYAHHAEYRKAYYNQIDKIVKNEQFKKEKLDSSIPKPQELDPVGPADFAAAEQTRIDNAPKTPDVSVPATIPPGDQNSRPVGETPTTRLQKLINPNMSRPADPVDVPRPISLPPQTETPPPTPPVVVVNNEVVEQSSPRQMERGTLPQDPADMPSPVTSGRPSLNISYKSL